ncbi:MAG: multiheme c-type cytochrome, partial [Candidatus Hydrothermarchaeaceae archaeon]
MNKVICIWLCVGLALFWGVVNPGWALENEVAADTSYVGAEKCKLCHINEYETWSKTKHAEAYEVMDHAYQMLKETGRGIRPWIEIGRTEE